MRFDIRYQPSYSLAIVGLEAGEAIQAEAGAMVSMTSNVEIATGLKGGLVSSVLRSLLGGETIFSNVFTARDAPGEVTLAPPLPGDLTLVEMKGETLLVQSGSFLASHPEISLDLSWGGGRTFFGREGLFLLKASGSGPFLVSSYGAIHRVDLTERPYVVDTGHVVAFSSSLSFNVRRVAGWKSTFLSGEGLVCEFTGRGPLWLQTRSTDAFLSWLIPRLPHQRGGGG